MRRTPSADMSQRLRMIGHSRAHEGSNASIDVAWGVEGRERLYGDREGPPDARYIRESGCDAVRGTPARSSVAAARGWAYHGRAHRGRWSLRLQRCVRAGRIWDGDDVYASRVGVEHDQGRLQRRWQDGPGL